ncbi:hypothetical protein APT65_00073 [Trabzonvirus APT65]|uniref:Uncharacterized protein n=1 Tax=Aeromonas phage APT65 TaxID=2982914 RepID=A0A9E8K1Y3_9CAUD|nr:hypothetical protein APT65_00073 [Aeromonas phage APT65]
MEYEIQGVKEVFIEGYGYHVERAEDKDADFFGLYKRNEKNLAVWVSDHNTRKEAEEAMEIKMKNQPLKYWKLMQTSEGGIPSFTTYKTREKARKYKRLMKKLLGVNTQLLRCSLQEIDGVFIEVSVKVH